ncbi:MAG TPA: exopolysaccharide biosynthesis polyprenyl glycosylphosphotransferase [Vicinamibacterales bacterium]
MVYSTLAAELLPKDVPAFVPQTRTDEIAVRTLIVGTGRWAATVIAALGKEGNRYLVGAVDVERRPELFEMAPETPWLGDLTTLAAVAVRHAVDEICVALPLRSRFDEWLQVQAIGRELGIAVSLRFDLGDDHAAIKWVSDAMLLVANRHPASLGLTPAIKRAFDIVVAALALVAVSPILLAAAIAVKATSPGPIFFRQPRVGRGRRVFGMVKFRTMVQDAERLRHELKDQNSAKGIIFKIVNDPRLTIVGPFLRRTSIDELPQLWNVLRGDMSLVGPRPLPTWVYEQIDEPRFHRRFSVLPGMTGLWQVRGRPQEYWLMAEHDLRYVREWSFWLDLKILVLTIPAVMQRKGAV